jgi:hypothetical protein
MMRKLGSMDVQPMLDEIDDSLWEPTGTTRPGYGNQWVGTEIQNLICYTKSYRSESLNLQYSPCEYETPLDDLCLNGFRPTNALFLYPEAMKTLVEFATKYGGKYARAMYHRTPPDYRVGIHLDAQPDKFGPSAYDEYHSDKRDHKIIFYYKKDRFHVIIDGSFEYTVDHEEEDILYETPNFTLEDMVQPVTKVWSKGEIWWFNNKRPHTSYNHGNIPKINLVFDIEGATI